MAGPKKLSHDDRILWGKVARSTRPMPGKLDEIIFFEQEVKAENAGRFVENPKAGIADEPVADSPLPAGKGYKRHHPLERPVKRKIARGRLPLEARIDLHGMFQSEAHAMLHDFLVRAHERGLRHVLVITGKGSSTGSQGALRRAVPLWFAKPEFRFLISSFEIAAPNHGGDGALYVRLARQPGETS